MIWSSGINYPYFINSAATLPIFVLFLIYFLSYFYMLIKTNPYFWQIIYEIVVFPHPQGPNIIIWRGLLLIGADNFNFHLFLICYTIYDY